MNPVSNNNDAPNSALSNIDNSGTGQVNPSAQSDSASQASQSAGTSQTVDSGFSQSSTQGAPLEEKSPIQHHVDSLNAEEQPVDTNVAPTEKPLGDLDTTKAKILLAEDEYDARVIYLDILQAAGFETDGAENGRVTLELLTKKKYDLLLLDIIMPDIDGISVLTEVVKDPAKYGSPKVVMLTNIGGDLAIDKALKIGANGYMLKSETDPEQLVAVVKKYLQGESHVKVQSSLYQ